MLATNPVDPRPLGRIDLIGPVGPNSPWPRKPGKSSFPVAKFLGVSAVVLGAYVVLGSIGADAVQPAAKVADPVTKAAPVTSAPVEGEFRLAPGNNAPQGIVRIEMPAAVPGEYRLAPGNNAPQGIVVQVGEPVPGEFRLAPGNNQPQGSVSGK